MNIDLNNKELTLACYRYECTGCETLTFSPKFQVTIDDIFPTTFGKCPQCEAQCVITMIKDKVVKA